MKFEREPLVLRIFASLADGAAPLALDDRRAAREALRRVLFEGEKFEEAFGIAPSPGERSFATKSAHAKRDEMLSAAAQTFFPDLSIRAQAEKLAEVGEKIAGTWPRESGAAECPRRHKGKLEATMWELARLGFVGLGEESIRRSIMRRKRWFTSYPYS